MMNANPVLRLLLIIAVGMFLFGKVLGQAFGSVSGRARSLARARAAKRRKAKNRKRK